MYENEKGSSIGDENIFELFMFSLSPPLPRPILRSFFLLIVV